MIATRTTRGGFSLAEVLLAIIILGMGMTMAAALFPAAVSENRDSINDISATMICDNALSLAADRLTPADVTDTAMVVLADAANTGSFTAAEQKFPADPPDPADATDTNKGFVLLGRRVPNDSSNTEDDSRQLVAVAYAKITEGAVTAETVTGDIAVEGTTSVFTADDDTHLRVGSPLIVAGTGDFARIVNLNNDDNTAILDRQLTAITGITAYVVVEAGVATRSPAILTVSRTVKLQP